MSQDSNQCSLFISDLHLDPERKNINQIFFEFLEGRALKAEALYILGDLFEVWIGDDDLTDFHQQVIAAFRKYNSQGIKLFFMHGNRDFLLGDEFIQQCGAQLLEDPFILDLYGRKTLLCHGDTLCTLDQEYQKFRKTIRSERWAHEFLTKSLEERRNIALDLRRQSREKSENKSHNIMDVNQNDVLELLELTGTEFLIHGHTHRPAEHIIETSFGESKRLVLSDWYQAGHCLEVSSESYHVEDFV
ncbi:UDP-2,3-diacylglucosamine diphosphatase [hydrothermal vent metagenome]|uniref:UDP-2,3-diacylglucosamine diphosphatase n=1 Tax=hydrothermal vent metagenome TaxID=652676 RepID=A0A3B0Y9I5_9ZZZZ